MDRPFGNSSNVSSGRKSHRLRIGYLTPYIGDAEGNAVWQSLRREAARLDVDLTCLLTTRSSFVEGYWHNPLVDFIGPRNFDGLLLPPLRLFHSDEEAGRAHLVAKTGLTIVDCGAREPGDGRITLNVPALLAEAIRHLHKDHGCERIAVWYDSTIRGRTVRRVLREAGLDETFTYAEDEREDLLAHCEPGGKVIQGVVASSGRNLRTLAALLHDRGVLVPHDVRACTMQDFCLAEYVIPPLTAVGPQGADCTAQGLRQLVEGLRASRTPKGVRLGPDLRSRASCGCRLPAVPASGNAAVDRQLLYYRMLTEALTGDDPLREIDVQPWIEATMDATMGLVDPSWPVAPPKEPYNPYRGLFSESLEHAKVRALWTLQCTALERTGTGEAVAGYLRGCWRELVVEPYNMPGIELFTPRKTARKFHMAERRLFLGTGWRRLSTDALPEQLARVGIRDLYVLRRPSPDDSWKPDHLILSIRDGAIADPDPPSAWEPAGAYRELLASEDGTVEPVEVIATTYAPATEDAEIVAFAGDLDAASMELCRELLSSWAKAQAAIAERDHELFAERSFVQDLIDAIPDPLAIKDARGRYRRVNRAKCELHGRKAKGMIDREDFDLLPADLAQEVSWADRRVVADGEADLDRDFTYPGRGAYRSSRYPLRDARGAIVGLICVERSLDELRRRDDALREKEMLLRRSQKMEAIGRLSGGIAHDFNNLLTVIESFADLILVGEGDPTTRERAEKIIKASEKAAALTRNLLTFAANQPAEVEVCDLNRGVVEIVALLERTLGGDVAINTRLDRRPCMVQVDPGQIEQVLLNLAINAADSMPSGGEITIRTSHAKVTDNFRRGILEDGDYVRLDFSDTGTGVPPEHLPDIFDPFFTTKEPGKGTGLGLATSYGIIKQFGGTIEVDSREGEGTTFSIFLPHHGEGSREPDRMPRGRRETRAGDERILVVDDEPTILAVVVETLRAHGYEIASAEDPREALRLVETTEESFDLLLTDVVMPQMGGEDLARRVRELSPRTRVLYMSGYTDTAFQRPEGDAWPLEFIQKPFGGRELAERVREVLDVKAEG